MAKPSKRLSKSLDAFFKLLRATPRSWYVNHKGELRCPASAIFDGMSKIPECCPLTACQTNYLPVYATQSAARMLGLTDEQRVRVLHAADELKLSNTLTTSWGQRQHSLFRRRLLAATKPQHKDLVV